MVEIDAQRLKYQIIEIVQKFFDEHLDRDNVRLKEKFKQQYESLLQNHLSENASEISRVHHLIKEFGPALKSVLEPGQNYDRLMGEISPILNSALSNAEQKKLQSSLDEEEKERTFSSPKTMVIPSYDRPSCMRMLSVGIDIGSSTSHLIFSRLTLNRERSFLNPTNRFQLTDREILYESDIIFTPLIDRHTIDIEAIIKFCEDEYRKAGLTPDMVESGAVLVTGETAKKQNAEEIVRRLSSESGKFVSAAAGPNYESVLSAMGSGIVQRSLETQKTIMNVDVGGGTSNLAIAKNGIVLSTSCINVGGRLLGIKKDFKIWRIDEPTFFIMNELGMNYQLGDTITEEDVQRIAHTYASALIEVMQGNARSRISKELMMTSDIDFKVPVDHYSFSGGVAEMIYGNEGAYDDIGKYLAKEISTLAREAGLSIIEPENKIRATVIGAGAFTLSVSGSTCYFDSSIEFPIKNVPVIPVNITKENYSIDNVRTEIENAFVKYDRIEGDDLVALYFKDALYRSYNWLQEFVKAIENALPVSVRRKKMVILLFQTDIGKMVGLMIRRETAIQHNLICLDELFLEEGDWIDIGSPIHSGQAFPVTVKSLVFNQNKIYS
ncbi:MAG: ethanolamine ammonia-lyase reactivating factor EutA [Candidatus Thorarchaeota archaeon]|nr:ethanolamine ammonia-lyase reactivating factor EutA [Candidatus Thorarchaeota archaeon]